MTSPPGIINRRLPRLAAWCIEWVTISVVIFSLETMSLVIWITWSAVLGSNAAVCSSRTVPKLDRDVDVEHRQTVDGVRNGAATHATE